MIEQKEIDLVKKIQSGNSDAENELFSRFDVRIARKVRYSLGAANADWEDIVSEIQLALLDSLRKGKFDLNKSTSLGCYVYGITMNKVRDYFKLQKRQGVMTTNPPPENELSAEQEYEFENREMRDMLRTLLGKLKLKYKEVLYLRYYEEFSINQISQQIKLPPRRVSERINYALKLLRKECEKEKYFSIFESVLIIII